MGRLSEFPDALLLNILSFLPAKDVVATMLVSKRWQPLWKMVPNLIYDDDSDERFPRFVDRYLLLHEAPVIETLHFKLGQNSGAVDIGVWTSTALKRGVRKLIIKTDCGVNSKAPVILPRSLYSACSMLVRLKLKKVVLLDVTSPISFPCLKKLSLKCVKYPSDKFFQRLLSSCPVLESLVVRHCPDENVAIFTIKAPSLKSLALINKSDLEDTNIVFGFIIDTPSLESFDIYDRYEGGFCVIENEMPNIVVADVDVAYHPGNILSSITSVKFLTLSNIPSAKDAYPVGTVFCSLVYLEIWKYETEWLNLLMRVLKDSPNLRALKLDTLCDDDDDDEDEDEDEDDDDNDDDDDEDDVGDGDTDDDGDGDGDDDRVCWSEPSSVPECVRWNLETLEWSEYEGAEEEKELIAFILRNANRLKKATISTESTDEVNKKLEMIKELSLFPRRSPTCQLAFD